MRGFGLLLELPGAALHVCCLPPGAMLPTPTHGALPRHPRFAGLTCVWRVFYAIYLDLASFRSREGSRRDREREAEHFIDALRAAMLLSLGGCVVLQALGAVVGEERLELLLSSLLAGNLGLW